MHEEAIIHLRKIFSDEGIIRVITHLDTDGLSSGAIITHTLKKHNQNFWLSTVKQLEDGMLDKLLVEAQKQKWKALFFLDLGSSKLNKIKEFARHLPLFVIDHHELDPLFEQEDSLRDNMFFISNYQYKENMSASCLAYLLVKELDKTNKRLSQLAILGLIGDILDRNFGKNVQAIIEDARENGMQLRRGLTVFSAMRPIHKALEFSSNIFIPGVTGNSNGAVSMLRDLGIEIRNSQGYRTMLDLSKDEMSALITAILLRRASYNSTEEIINNIYLIKVAGHLWDSREMSTMLNACGRMGYSSMAIAFLTGSKRARDKIQDVYTKYKHHIIQGLNTVDSIKQVNEKYVVINARNMIKDTIIGTIISITASSFLYKEGTVIVGMAYRKDGKVKVSARIVKSRGKSNEDSEINLDGILRSIIRVTGGEVGGHLNAAGCLISKAKEKEFLELLDKKMSTEEIKITI